jgi:hypothetical protein
MWISGEPIDPSPTIEQAINGGHPWLEIECSRCKTPRDVDLAGLRQSLRPACTTLQPAWDAKSAPTLGNDPPRPCFNW